MESGDEEYIELNKRRVKIKNIRGYKNNIITNGISLEYQQILGYPHDQHHPYFFFYNENPDLDSEIGIFVSFRF